jgi:beta-galactosidase GanA
MLAMKLPETTQSKELWVIQNKGQLRALEFVSRFYVEEELKFMSGKKFSRYRPIWPRG